MFAMQFEGTFENIYEFLAFMAQVISGFLNSSGGDFPENRRHFLICQVGAQVSVEIVVVVKRLATLWRRDTATTEYGLRWILPLCRKELGQIDAKASAQLQEFLVGQR